MHVVGVCEGFFGTQVPRRDTNLHRGLCKWSIRMNTIEYTLEHIYVFHCIFIEVNSTTKEMDVPFTHPVLPNC